MIKRIMTPRAAVLAFAAPLLITATAAAAPGPVAKAKIAKTKAAKTTLHAYHGHRGPLVPPPVQAHHATKHHYGYGGYRYSKPLHHHGYKSYHGHYRKGYKVNQFGQTAREVKGLRRDAFRQCASAVARKGYRAGAYDVDIDREDSRIRQIAPYGFVVRLFDVEAETRRGYIEANITCEVRRGQVVDLDGLPRVKGYGYHHKTRYHY